MGYDIERLKSKLEQLKNPRSGSNPHIWRPSTEKKVVRLIGYPFGDDPFVERWFHFGIGMGPSILCPRQNFGKVCPACEFAKTLDKKESSKLWPKQRIYAVLVDREDSPLKPKYWGFSPTLYQKFIENLLNEEYSHYMDPERGIDLYVQSIEKSFDRKSDGKKINMTVPDFTFSRKDSRLAESDKDIREILNAIVPIEDVFQPLTNSDIEKRLASWLSYNEEQAEERSSESSRGGEEERVKEDNNVDSVDEELEKALA